jgi:heme exporter protein A
MIEVRDLVKSFGGKMALDGLDLDVAEGEFLTLVGPNGAGKTTLIRILATLTRPTRGSVRVAGCDLPKQGNEVRRRIGLASHQTLLYGDLSAEENLRFYGRMYDVPDLEEGITALLQRVGLDHRRHDLVRTFSRGMQQRLSLARALLHDPAILLLDEPYTGLDQQAAEMLREVLVTLGGRSHTVLMTTHNLERGLELCDRAAILVNGRIVYQEAKDSLDVANFRETYRRCLNVSPFDSAQGRRFTFHSGVGR